MSGAAGSSAFGDSGVALGSAMGAFARACVGRSEVGARLGPSDEAPASGVSFAAGAAAVARSSLGGVGSASGSRRRRRERRRIDRRGGSRQNHGRARGRRLVVRAHDSIGVPNDERTENESERKADAREREKNVAEPGTLTPRRSRPRPRSRGAARLEREAPSGCAGCRRKPAEPGRCSARRWQRCS